MISSCKKAGKAVRVISIWLNEGRYMKRRLQRTALLVSKQEVNSHMNQNLGTFTVDEILGASGTKSLPPNARY